MSIVLKYKINLIKSKSSESGEPPANGEEVAQSRKKRQAEEVNTEEPPSETSDAEGAVAAESAEADAGVGADAGKGAEGGQSAGAEKGKAPKNKGKKTRAIRQVCRVRPAKVTKRRSTIGTKHRPTH
ncbi:hypothetical protein niasHT_037460 [Heterodera trifolii]|uniref:Uncharacterized protein n=1 Tax=Heterodera trifolii TaxID=157864 RepID=A0ABD2IF02_9BILA